MNMEDRVQWTQDDFDLLSWHDNRIHAISFVCPDEGYENDLVLDIDFIFEWIKTPSDGFRFRVAPATLAFHNVTKTRIGVELVYRESLEIDRIEREDVSTVPERETGCRPHRYTIFLQCLSGPTNSIVVESYAFEMKLRKPPIAQKSQWLEAEDR
jgi:hypothetical protein